MTPEQLRNKARLFERLALGALVWGNPFGRGQASAFRVCARALRKDAAHEDGYDVRYLPSGERRAW
jgi:hypothetical protein